MLEFDLVGTFLNFADMFGPEGGEGSEHDPANKWQGVFWFEYGPCRAIWTQFTTNFLDLHDKMSGSWSQPRI